MVPASAAFLGSFLAFDFRTGARHTRHRIFMRHNHEPQPARRTDHLAHAQHTPRRVTHAVRAPPPPQSPPRRPSRLYACSAALSLSQRQRPPRRPCSDPRARPLLTLSRPVLSRSPGQAMPEARDAHTCTPASSPITHTRTRTPVPTALTRRRAYTAAPMRRDSSQTLDLRDARRTHG